MEFFKNKKPVFAVRAFVKRVSPPPKFRKEWTRFALIGFVIFIVLNGANVYLKGKELVSENQDPARAGFQALEQGIASLKNRDFTQAKMFFQNAEKALRTVRQNTASLTAQANSFLDQSLYLDTAQKLMESGELTAKMGQEFIVFAENLRKVHWGADTAWPKELHSIQEALERFLAQSIRLQQNLTTLNPTVLPPRFRDTLRVAQGQIGQLLAWLKKGDVGAKAALKLLGDQKSHTILILLQNKNERRATGGFIGSFILVTLRDGVIQKQEFHDVYEADGQLTKRLPAPPGIDQVADQWYLRDANYSPDFPTSARQVMWFLEHSNGPTVDTVVAVDQTVAQKLLELTGPVTLKNFPFTLKSDNVDELLSFYTEAKLGGIQTPKKLLFDLIPALQRRLAKLRNFEAVIPVAQELIAEGHIQFYSPDSDVEALAETLGMDGRLLAPLPQTDYLNVITTSIGGNKSDKYIQMELNHQPEVAADGSVTDHLAITKRHTWNEQRWVRFQRWVDYYRAHRLPLDTLHFILGGGPNVDYLRVYVPEGSRLLKSEGVQEVKTLSDLGYTVFAFTLKVDAGQSQSVTLDYQLPFKKDYKLVTQRQAGAANVTWLTQPAALSP